MNESDDQRAPKVGNEPDKKTAAVMLSESKRCRVPAIQNESSQRRVPWSANEPDAIEFHAR